MAAIDKTYTNSYKNYTDLIEWARNNKFTCPNGTIVNVLNSIYSYWTEEDFNKAINEGHTLPVMNTSLSTDYYLIKYCPLQFVQDRMIEVYNEDYYNAIKNGTSDYDTFTKEGKYGTHCRLISAPQKHFRNNRPYKQAYWFVDVTLPEDFKGYLCYMEKYDKWVWPNELYGDSDISSCAFNSKTRKAIERKIRKWQLPKGTIVHISGRYEGDDYKYLVY